MPRGRRKVVTVLSEEEAVPPTPQKQQPDVTESICEPSDIDSEPEVPLVARKKPRLEDVTTVGPRPAKAAALSNALWLNAGAPKGRAPQKSAGKSSAASRGKLKAGGIEGQSSGLSTKKAKKPGLPHAHLPPVLDADKLASSDDDGEDTLTPTEIMNTHATWTGSRDDGRDQGCDATEDAQAWLSDGASDHDSDRDSCQDYEIESDDPDIEKLVNLDGRALTHKLISERPTWVRMEKGKSRATSKWAPASAPVPQIPSTSSAVSVSNVGGDGARKKLRPVSNHQLPSLQRVFQDKPKDSLTRTKAAKIYEEENEAPSQQSMWPAHTNLVRSPSGEYKLTAQTYELRAVIRMALPSIMAKICFVDFFPSSATRTAWSKTFLTAASRQLMAAAQNNRLVAMRYDAIRDRLRRDGDYSRILGKLLAAHVPTFRRNLKICSAQIMAPLFDLKAGCENEVEWYTSQMRYIYPCDAKSGKVDIIRPYQNKAISSAISVFYMTSHADIIDAHQALFRQENASDELPDSMIASAATTLYASLYEWRYGYYLKTEFSANSFASVYISHINVLAELQRDNPRSYHSLKALLFKVTRDMSCAPPSNVQHDTTRLHDVHNIATD